MEKSASLDGAAVPVNPGERLFRFELEGGPSIEQTLEPVAPPVPMAAYVLGGVGVAALGGFTYFGIKATSTR